MQDPISPRYGKWKMRVIDLQSGLQDAEKAAKRLTEEAYSRGSNDNISCIVVRFNF